jgi:hypothetical protein
MAGTLAGIPAICIDEASLSIMPVVIPVPIRGGLGLVHVPVLVSYHPMSARGMVILAIVAGYRIADKAAHDRAADEAARAAMG